MASEEIQKTSQNYTDAGNEMSASFLAAKERSAQTLAKLHENPAAFRMLTGDRPTGRLHLGHYFGSILERVAMQNLGVNTNIIIADYQVITDRDTTDHIQDNVFNMVLDYLAAGIDPHKTMIFTHSAVAAENQLMLPFLSLVTEAELLRNPTVKSEMEASYGNSIMLSATAEETAKLIKKSPTDSERFITFDPLNRPQVSALLTTAGLVTKRPPEEIAQEIGHAGAGALKKYVIDSVNDFLAPLRERRAELAQDMDYIKDVLHDGNRRANEIANETLDQVRDAMGMKY